MSDLHILLKREAEKATQSELASLPCCPICGAKPFVSGDAPDGFWKGWSAGCPRYCFYDGIHGHDENTPEEEYLTRFGFITKEAAVEWWKKRASR